MKKISIFIVAIALSCAAFGQYQVEVKNEGHGAVTFFLPGFACSGAVWDETLNHMKIPGEYHVFTYAGFGGVPAVDFPWYEKVRDGLVAYVKDNNFEYINLVGHSMGGTLAMDIALAVPEVVGRMVLVDALPCIREVIMPGVPPEFIQYDSPYNQQQLSLNGEQFSQMVAMMAENMTENHQKAALISNWMLEADRATYVYGYTDLLKVDQRQLLQQISAAVLVLGAPSPDRETVMATFNEAYFNLENKIIAIAPSGKHFIMFDEADWFYGQLNRFLNHD